ncbi:polysaccharide lyase [Reichenbachiella sp. MALMAid0571]|uniref:polysaccharide lyase n=1 Tax=Reichenbachiella sp. MALMAid0571 TaxID=3143939 RepID=UPI0032E0216E
MLRLINLILLTSPFAMMSCGDSGSNPSDEEKISFKIEVPRIDFVEMAQDQRHETDQSTIWYDDFSSDKGYFGKKGIVDTNVDFGTDGGSADMGFDEGAVDGRGNRQVAFGGFPASSSVVKAGQKFDEIYWRMYVKHEHGWKGSPFKMSRATSIVSDNWQQAMIAHVWNGSDEDAGITLDPARGVDGQTDKIKTTKYNDFDNLSWLGNQPVSDFKISSTGESGYWVLVECRVKLNTPGMDDGENQLWIDGRLETERKNLNFRGSYTQHGVNAVFLESYWNGGAVKTQSRWFDNFVISTNPIGPVISPSNPTLYKTPYFGAGELAGWEVELASDYEGNDVVYKSSFLGTEEKVVVDSSNGVFSGSLEGKTALSSGEIYYSRVRQKNTEGFYSNWSRWHQGIKVE